MVRCGLLLLHAFCLYLRQITLPLQLHIGRPLKMQQLRDLLGEDIYPHDRQPLLILLDLRGHRLGDTYAQLAL